MNLPDAKYNRYRFVGHSIDSGIDSRLKSIVYSQAIDFELVK